MRRAVIEPGPPDGGVVRGPGASRVTLPRTSPRILSFIREIAPRCAGPALTGALIAMFAVVHAVLAIGRHDAFGTWGFDLGIYDQGAWLVARGERFLTTRGMDVWGHHVNLVAVMFAPLSWLGGGPRTLIALQALVLSLGAIPAHRLADRRLGGGWAGPVGAVMFLATPALGWLAWNNLHWEAFAVTPLMFAWWWGTERRWVPAALATLTALSTREEVGLVVALLGLALLHHLRQVPASQRDRVFAGLGAALGAAWYLACTKLVMPAALGGADPYYFARFYGDWGGSAGELVRNVITRPGDVVTTSTRPDRLELWARLVVPTGGLALLGTPVLLAAGPQALAVALGSQWFLRDVRFQYTALMLAPLLLAAIEGAGRLVRRWPRARQAVIGWMLISAVAGHAWLAPSPLGSGRDQWSGVADAAPFRAAVAMAGDGDGVSAIDNVVPHLTMRRDAFIYPNPFIPVVYGTSSKDRAPLDVVNRVRWIIWRPDATASGGRLLDAELFAALTNDLRAYEIASEPGDGLLVARSVRPLAAVELEGLRVRFASRPSS